MYQGKEVGFAKVNLLCNSKTKNSRMAELEKIYMLPEFKGKGIGKFALNAIIALVKKLNKNRLLLNVIDQNKEAIIFYEKLGFKFHSRTKLELPYFREELKGMQRMVLEL